MHIDELNIQFECDQSWEDFQTGDDHADEDARGYCERCEEEVVNLSELSEEEARRILNADDSPCVYAVYDGADGTVVFNDAPAAGSQLHDQRRGSYAMIAAGVASVMFTLGSLQILDRRPVRQQVQDRIQSVVEDAETTRTLMDGLGFESSESDSDELHQLASAVETDLEGELAVHLQPITTLDTMFAALKSVFGDGKIEKKFQEAEEPVTTTGVTF